MIIGIFGNLSSGKTLLSVKLLDDELKKNPETKIISNIKLKFKYLHLDLDGVVQNIIKNPKLFENAILFLDEIHNLVDARRSSASLNVDFSRFITQIGKLGCSLIFTSQLFSSQVDLRVRELCDILCFCERHDEYGRPLILGERIVKGKIYIQVTIFIKRFGGLLSSPKMVQFDPSPYYDLYDTKEIVLMDRDKYLKSNSFYSPQSF